jgi:hypothetical protein
LNAVADALSLSQRDKTTMETHALSSPSFTMYKTLCDELVVHPKALQIRAKLVTGTAPVGWTEVDGILMFQGIPSFLMTQHYGHNSWNTCIPWAVKVMRIHYINYDRHSIVHRHNDELTTLCVAARCARKTRLDIYIQHVFSNHFQSQARYGMI